MTKLKAFYNLWKGSESWWLTTRIMLGILTITNTIFIFQSIEKDEMEWKERRYYISLLKKIKSENSIWSFTFFFTV